MRPSTAIAAWLLVAFGLAACAPSTMEDGGGARGDLEGVEAFAARVVEPLDLLAAWVEGTARDGTPASWPDVFARGARSTPLGIVGDSRQLGRATLTLDRGAEQDPNLDPREAFGWFEERASRSNRASLGFKIVSVEHGDAEITTRVRVEFQWAPVERRAEHPASMVAVWNVSWSPGEEPRILKIRRLHGEQTALAGTRSLFGDRSSFVLGDLWVDRTLKQGAEYWNGKIDALGESNLMGHQGLAIGDLSGDGLEDIYVAMGSGLPNRMLIRQPDGTLVDRADEAGVAWLDDTKGVLIVDTDNDGDRDLLMALGNTIVLARNDSRGAFERFVTMKAPTSAPFYSLSAADYDLDGDLDIYGVRYVEQSYGVSVPLPFHDANNGPSNHLMRNEGGDRFVDATIEAGLDGNNRRFSLIGAWADYDLDGDPDLYVANDFGRNNLYRNDGGSFVDVAAELGVEDQAAGMGVSWADYDADGDLDLHVTNMYSAAGNRVAYQPDFQPAMDEASRNAVQRHASGNTLFAQQDGVFQDVSDEAGVRMGRWGWGALFTDIDNDALQDLLVPNGFITGPLEDDL